jgi:hypothetical protein
LNERGVGGIGDSKSPALEPSDHEPRTFPGRQQRHAGGESLADDLMLGAGSIAFFLYGADTPETRRDVYRNPMRLSFFKHGALIAALKSSIRAEIAEAQQAARQKKLAG